MKTILTLIFCLTSLFASAQSIIASGGIEKAVNGNQFGGALTVETRKFWALGAFYQAGIGSQRGENILKNPFYGIVLQAPIAHVQRLSFLVLLRTGFINKNYFVVVPSFETRIRITQKMGISMGAGFRSGYPSLSAKVFVRIFK
jgi:hypothetical protein